MVKPALLALLFATLPFAARAANGEASVRGPAEAEALGELRRFALVAGANQGGAARVPLRFARSDARAVGDVLVELGGVARQDLLFLEDPGRADLEAALDAISARMAAAKPAAGRVELLVYYSGHSDERGLLLGEEQLPYRELKDRIDALPADVRVVVLDSCASGVLTRLKGGTMRPPFLVDAATEVRGHAFLTSASADEAAQESDRVGGSFFTHALVSGLRGAADANVDGRVTLNEAYQFAFHETLRRTQATRSGPQHASYDIQLAGSGDLVMTDLRAGDAALLLPEALFGRVFVRGARGQLVAEVDKREGRGLRLSLPAGEYDVLIEENGRARGARVALVEGASQPLDEDRLAPREREITVARGAATAPSGGTSPLPSLEEIAQLKDRGAMMVAGGSVSAALGACCLSLGALSLGVDVAQGRLGNCALGGSACILLGGLSAAFGVPVAWIGRERLDEAEALGAGLPPAPEAPGGRASPRDEVELPGYAY